MQNYLTEMGPAQSMRADIPQQCEVCRTINQGEIDKDMHKFGLKNLSFLP